MGRGSLAICRYTGCAKFWFLPQKSDFFAFMKYKVIVQVEEKVCGQEKHLSPTERSKSLHGDSHTLSQRNHVKSTEKETKDDRKHVTARRKPEIFTPDVFNCT